MLKHETISASWEPARGTIEYLESVGVPQRYAVEYALEFIVYHQEKGTTRVTNGWDSLFIRECGARYRREAIKPKHEQLPSDWPPNFSAKQQLETAGITQQTWQALLPEFHLLHKDLQEVRDDWPAEFVRYCQRHKFKVLAGGAR